MKANILIIGGGGHAKACIDVIELMGDYEIMGIVDKELLLGSKVLNYPVVGSDDDLPTLLKTCPNLFLAIGQIKSPVVRKRIVENCLKLGAKFPVIISPFAYVSKHSSIGQGTIVMHGAVIQADAVVGDFCILNDRCLLEHDCKVGKFTHVSTGAILNGNVSVGEETFIGSGSVVIQETNIGNNVIVGANSTVKRDVIRGEKVI